VREPTETVRAVLTRFIVIFEEFVVFYKLFETKLMECKSCS